MSPSKRRRKKDSTSCSVSFCAGVACACECSARARVGRVSTREAVRGHRSAGEGRARVSHTRLGGQQEVRRELDLRLERAAVLCAQTRGQQKRDRVGTACAKQRRECAAACSAARAPPARACLAHEVTVHAGEQLARLRVCQRALARAGGEKARELKQALVPAVACCARCGAAAAPQHAHATCS